MLSRRGFIGAGTKGAFALAFADDGLARVAAAAARSADVAPNDLARDELLPSDWVAQDV